MNATARLLQDLADNADQTRRTIRNVTIMFAILTAIEAGTNGPTWTWLTYIVITLVFAHWWSEQTRLVNRCKTEGLHHR